MKLYSDLIEAQENLKYWREKEMELRLKAAEKLLEGKSVGTHHFKKGKFKIKATKKVTYSLDSEVLDINWNDMNDEERDAVKFKPSLLLNQYKDIDDHEVLDQAIIVKPATPTIVVEYVEE